MGDSVKAACMEAVPLCIVHPKTDDIVPGSHGQAIFEAATCKDKYGVWLCDASHNFFLTEEHLQLTRRFLSRASLPGRARTRRVENVIAVNTVTLQKGRERISESDADEEERL